MALKFFSIFILTSVFFFVSCQQSIINFDVEPSDEECLLEYFPEKTVVIYDITTDQDVKKVLKGPSSNILTETTNPTLKYALTAHSSGYFELCVQNPTAKTTQVYFDLKSGVAAKDYSSLAKTKDIQPIEIQLQKVADKRNALNHFISVSQIHDKMLESDLNSLSSKVVFYSLLLIGVMMSIGILETVYLKKFMERRKII